MYSKPVPAPDEEGRVISHYSVNAHPEQAFHILFAVYRPYHHDGIPGMHGADEAIGDDPDPVVCLRNLEDDLPCEPGRKGMRLLPDDKGEHFLRGD